MYVPPAPVDGLLVAIGTVVAVGTAGPEGVVGCVVAVGFLDAVVAVGCAGTAVAVGGTGVTVGLGVIVGVGDGGPGGGVIGVGTNVGGGGGVLAAANVCSDTLWNGLLIMIRPAVSGTATRRDKRLFIQDSLRVGFAFGSPVCREMVGTIIIAARCLPIASLTRRWCDVDRASLRPGCRGKPTRSGSLHPPFRSRSAKFHRLLRLSTSIIQMAFRSVNEEFTLPS